MPETELTLPAVFKEHGYNTALIGKAHFQPYQHDPVSPSMESKARWKNGELDDWNGPYYGFDHVEITAGHGEQVEGHYEGHYGRWREHNFPNLKLRFEGAQDYLRDPEFQCYKSAIPVEAHHSTWVADRAIAAIERQDGTCPFYLQVSFPDPHHPFTPPEPYASMFDDVEFPEPHYVVGENENKPLPWREAMTQSPFEGNGCAHHYPSFRGEVYQAVLAHTHGMIALIDASIGRILTRLSDLGLDENTIVVFTSDHGDFLGDHGMLFKGPFCCRSLLNIPLIIAEPNGPKDRVDSISSNIDVAPELLYRCGISIPEEFQGLPLTRSGNNQFREYALSAAWYCRGSEYFNYSICTNEWRLTVYPVLTQGELYNHTISVMQSYNLSDDPFENQNQYNNPACNGPKEELLRCLQIEHGRASGTVQRKVALW